MDPLSVAGAVATAITTTIKVIKFLQDARHAKKERQEWMGNLKNIQEYLEELERRLKIPKIANTPWYRNFIKAMGVDNKTLSNLNASPANIRSDSAFSQLDSKLKELQIRLKPQAGWRHHEYFRRVLHFFNKADFVTMFADLDRLQSAFDRQIQLDQFVLSEATYVDVLETKNLIQSQQQEKNRGDALACLSKLDFRDRQNQIFGTSFRDGSSPPGQWLLTSEEFLAWRAGRPWIFYCVGKPGAGKTVLSSIVINHLKDHIRQQAKSEQFVVVFLYLDYKETQVQTQTNLLRSVLHQLLRNRSSNLLCDEAREFLESGSDNVPSDQEVLRILSAEVGTPAFERMYLIVDALDEYPEEERPKLLDTCRDISQTKLSLLVTSRPSDRGDQPYIQCSKCPADKLRYLSLYFSCPICDKFDICQDCKDNGESCKENHNLMEPETVIKEVVAPNDEIERFIECTMREQLGVSRIKRGIDRAGTGPVMATRLAKLFERLDLTAASKLMSEISEAVVRSAEGMYLIAKLHLDSLKVQHTQGGLRQALRDLSGRADKIYSNLMSRIQDQSKEDRSLAMQVISWVFCAQRPLNIAELLQALAARKSDDESMLNDHQTDIAIVVRVTLGLVYAESSEGAVRLVHRTAHEYLEHDWRDLFPDAPTDIALTALKYLEFNAISTPCSGEREDQQVDSKLQKYPFLAYASICWGAHVREVFHNAQVRDRVVDFLKHPSRLSAVVQTAWYASSQSQAKVAWSVRGGINAIHVCAYYGLDSCIAMLLNELPDVQIDSQDEKLEQTPLMYACMRGHSDTVSTCVKLGAQVNLVNIKGNTAASLAILNGNPDIVAVMMTAKEVDPPLMLNAVDQEQHGRNVLMLAALNGYESLLLDILGRPEINVNDRDTNGYTALALAATTTHISIVEILLNHVNVDLPNDIGSTPLIIAAEGGKHEMVMEMLKHNANWRLQNYDGHTAFMKAIIHGHAQVVKVLLAHKAFDQIEDASRRTAMHIACSAEETKSDMIDLLHEQGLEADAKDDRGRTPLHHACRVGNIEVAKAILALHADTCIKDSFERTPLHVAWQNGHTDLVKLIQCHHDQASTPLEPIPETSCLPLWSMAKLGYVQLVQDTLNKVCTDLEIQDPDTESTPLHWAIRSNNFEKGLEIAEILLKASARTSAIDDHGRTPLHIAAYKRYYEAALLLLDYNADPKTRDSWELSPLSIAQSRKFYVLAAKLLDVSEFVEEKSSSQELQGTFCAAVENGFLRAARLLADHGGVDLEGRDGEGYTTMELAKASGDDEMLQWLRGRLYQHE